MSGNVSFSIRLKLLALLLGLRLRSGPFRHAFFHGPCAARVVSGVRASIFPQVLIPRPTVIKLIDKE
jgi:hypothetical protein